MRPRYPVLIPARSWSRNFYKLLKFIQNFVEVLQVTASKAFSSVLDIHGHLVSPVEDRITPTSRRAGRLNSGLTLAKILRPKWRPSDHSRVCCSLVTFVTSLAVIILVIYWILAASSVKAISSTGLIQHFRLEQAIQDGVRLACFPPICEYCRVQDFDFVDRGLSVISSTGLPVPRPIFGISAISSTGLAISGSVTT